MEQKTLEERVLKTIGEQLGIAVHELKLESNLVNDLGADSLDKIELIMGLEDEFEIEIPDELAENVKTVQETIDCVKKALGQEDAQDAAAVEARKSEASFEVDLDKI